MRSTVHKNTATKQSNGTTSAIWNKQDVDSEQEHMESFHLGKPFSKPGIPSSADDKPNPPNHISFDFSKLPIFSPQQARIQPKLKINAIGDKYEQEADRMADQVMRMPESIVQRKSQWGPILPRPVAMQRMGEAYAKEEEEETLQTKSSRNIGGIVPPTIAQQIHSSRGSGQMMDTGTRSFMETRFRADFGKVRIHADHNAAMFNRNLQARAFTLGRDIYFNQGQYSPDAGDGRKLLAHELTHVVQQGAVGDSSIQRKAQKSEPATVSYPIKVPPGTKSVQEFLRYVELIIYGEVKNFEWKNSKTGVLAKEKYSNINEHIGKIVIFFSSYSAPSNVSEDKKANDKAYSALGVTEKESVNDEIDTRYFGTEAFENGSQIKPNETGKIAIWNSFKRQVMAEKAKLDNLPLSVKEFLQSDQTFTPKNYTQLAKVADLLNQFNNADFLDYKSKINFETTDLEVLRESIQQYLDSKLERQADTKKRETTKTKLFGLKALYEQYKRVKSLPIPSTIGFELHGGEESPRASDRRGERITIMRAENEAEQESFNSNLKANNFSSISEFEKYITDYESAFEKETIAIADDLLLRYRHKLFEEEKKVNSDAYISSLFSQLSSSGAKEHFQSADFKDATANGIMRDPLGGYARGDIELKSSLRSEASFERAAGNAAISALPSTLVKEEGFDRESLTSVSSKEELKSTLLSYIKEKKESITETWDDIHANPEHIYELDKLFAASIATQGIEKNSIFDLIIANKAEEINKYKILKAVCFIVIAVALTIATFGTAGPLAIAAGVATAGLSIYDIYEAIEDYKRNNAANDVGLLTDDPSLIWVMLAIGGAAIDLAALSTVLKAAKPMSIAATEFNGLGDVTKLENDLKKITELSEGIRKNILASAKAEAKAKQALKSLVVPDGKLRMVIVPGGEEFAKIIVAAYQYAKKGVLDFSTFVKELKIAKLIDDFERLTDSEKLILKEAFEKGKSLSLTEEISAEIEKAMGENDFAKLYRLIKGEKKLDFSQLDIDSVMGHIKTGPKERVRSIKGIKGCHDATEWAKIRQVDEAGFTMPIGKKLDEVPEVIITSVDGHNVPGIRVVRYKIPSLDKQNKTTGALRQVPPKTIYDPAVWTDIKLRTALEEALQDAATKNGGVWGEGLFDGVTKSGFVIRGYIRNGKLDTFYFL
jgi:hypothetical protein